MKKFDVQTRSHLVDEVSLNISFFLYLHSSMQGLWCLWMCQKLIKNDEIYIGIISFLHHHYDAWG